MILTQSREMMFYQLLLLKEAAKSIESFLKYHLLELVDYLYFDFMVRIFFRTFFLLVFELFHHLKLYLDIVKIFKNYQY